MENADGRDREVADFGVGVGQKGVVDTSDTVVICRPLRRAADCRGEGVPVGYSRADINLASIEVSTREISTGSMMQKWYSETRYESKMTD